MQSKTLEKQTFKLVKTSKHTDPKPNKKRLHSVWFLAVLPAVILYYECVFRLTTTGGLFNRGTLSMVLFSIAYGLVCYLPVSFLKKSRAVHAVMLSLIGLIAFLYLVQNFVYRQFKIFYDLNTIIYGSSDAVGEYTADMFRLVFCPAGLFRILLFAIPLILYAVFGTRYFSAVSANLVRRVFAVATSVFCYGLSLVLIYTNALTLSSYKTEYNYQSAVQHFGLITGMGLDVKYMVFGGANQDFDLQNQADLPPLPDSDQSNDSQAPTQTSQDETSAEPVEYGINQMELNLTGGDKEIAQLHSYVSSLTASKKNRYTGLFQGKNLIFITAEAFTKEVIDPELTPTLYRLATKGIQFLDYYQPASAGTTGGEYQNVFGMMPTEGGVSFKNTANHYNYMTIGSQLNRLGYYGKAFHNNSYTYYSRNQTHTNLGYSDGFMGMGNGMEQYVKNAWPQSDLEMFQGTLPALIEKQPFNSYYMTVSGHSGYSKSGNSMTARNWESVAHLPKSDAVKGYLAANLELEKAMAYVVSELEQKGIADNTVICITTDHFPYGLDADAKLGNMPYLSELYGYEVEDYFQRDHSACILWCGALEKEEPIVVKQPSFSLDLLPTLSNLFGTEFDSRLFPGRDVFSDAQALVFNTNYDWKTAYGTYYASKNLFVPTDENTALPDGYVEAIKSVVRNKMLYCRLALSKDYFRCLFAN